MKDFFNLERKLINFEKILIRKIKNFKGGFSSILGCDWSEPVRLPDWSESVQDSDWSD